jgi:hypothetical protein
MFRVLGIYNFAVNMNFQPMIIHELSFKLKMKNCSKKGMMKLLMVEDAAQEYRIKGTHFMSSMQIECVSSKDFFIDKREQIYQ